MHVTSGDQFDWHSFSQSLLAQDTHYWNLHYGTQSTLLGGAVIGSVADLSATYYNPGWLALKKDAGVILSARVYDVNTLEIEGDGIQKRSISSFGISPSPSLIAGRLPSDSLIGQKLTYSIITRQSFDSKLESRGVLEVAPGSILPGGGTLTEEVVFGSDLAEYWGGITWAGPLGERVGFGVTSYAALRIQRKRNEFTFKALQASGDLANINRTTDYDYYNVRLLWKAGLAFDLSPILLGVSVTTPSLNLFGSGYTYLNASSVGFDIDGDGEADPILAADYQDELSATYRSSWAVGAGVAYSFGRFKLNFSAEWYNSIPEYAVLDPEGFVVQTTGETLKNALTVEYAAVLNYGIGVEYDATETIDLYLSYVTDFSADVPGTKTNLTVSNWDLRHITGGGVFSFGRADVTLGLGYAFGSSKIPKEEVPVIDNLLDNTGEGPPALTGTSRRLKIIFAFSFAL
ncbi:MAG: hypothetical protein WBD30_12065 [Bacteroidota bacterium]